MKTTPEDNERKDAPDEESFAGRVGDLGPNVDGRRLGGEPWALHDTAPDTRADDPLMAAYQSKETVTNDAVAGETVTSDAVAGETVEGGAGDEEPTGGNDLDDEDVDLGTDLRDVNER